MSRRSRSAMIAAASPIDGPSIGDSSTSIGRRPRRRMMSRQERTTRRRSHLRTIGIAEGGQVAPGPDEAVLDRVSRELGVPEDEPGRRVQPRDERAGKHREGVMIAPLRSLDELSLVHGPPDFVAARRFSSRSDGSRHPWRETFHHLVVNRDGPSGSAPPGRPLPSRSRDRATRRGCGSRRPGCCRTR